MNIFFLKLNWILLLNYLQFKISLLLSKTFLKFHNKILYTNLIIKTYYCISSKSYNKVQSSVCWLSKIYQCHHHGLFSTSRWACNNANPFNHSSDILDLIHVLIHCNDEKFRSAVASVAGNVISIFINTRKKVRVTPFESN